MLLEQRGELSSAIPSYKFNQHYFSGLARLTSARITEPTPGVNPAQIKKPSPADFCLGIFWYKIDRLINCWAWLDLLVFGIFY